MACNSLVALPRACGTEGIMAGVEKLYMIAYTDLAAASGALAGEVFTKATNGMVNAIGLETGKKFVEIGTLKSAVGLTSALTKNQQNGTAFYTPTLTVALADMSLENEKFVKDVTFQPVAVLVKSRTGKFFVAGLNGQFELSAAESGLGTSESDNYGYSLTFTGLEAGPIAQVDPTVISTLIA